MPLTLRPYRGDEDYWRIRGFIREVYLANGRRSRPWDLLRFDYWRCFIAEVLTHHRVEESIFLWEEGDRIVAVLQPDGRGEGFFLTRPGEANESLIADMAVVAEECLSVERDGKRHLRLWSHESDRITPTVLAGRGFKRQTWSETLRRRLINGVPPAVLPAPGYSLRSLGGEEELPARSWLSWRVFHPNEPAEAYRGWEWYRNVQRVPLYRRDLDLVAVSDSGELAAFCTVWFDDVTRSAAFEPVGTNPDHQRRGLGKAIMAEGLRRALLLGANLATVSSYSPEAHALYAAAGFTDSESAHPWEREW
jgi:mycothiol synthase